jgi:hypothetical protein
MPGGVLAAKDRLFKTSFSSAATLDAVVLRYSLSPVDSFTPSGYNIAHLEDKRGCQE